MLLESAVFLGVRDYLLCGHFCEGLGVWYLCLYCCFCFICVLVCVLFFESVAQGVRFVVVFRVGVVGGGVVD